MNWLCVEYFAYLRWSRWIFCFINCPKYINAANRNVPSSGILPSNFALKRIRLIAWSLQIGPFNHQLVAGKSITHSKFSMPLTSATHSFPLLNLVQCLSGSLIILSFKETTFFRLRLIAFTIFSWKSFTLQMVDFISSFSGFHVSLLFLQWPVTGLSTPESFHINSMAAGHPVLFPQDNCVVSELSLSSVAENSWLGRFFYFDLFNWIMEKVCISSLTRVRRSWLYVYRSFFYIEYIANICCDPELDHDHLSSTKFSLQQLHIKKNPGKNDLFLSEIQV